MSDLYEKCVVLKYLPHDCDEHTVREVLDLVHGDFCFINKYKKLHRHVEFSNDIRWIVLFRSKEDALDCIQRGMFECSLPRGSCHVTPDYCSGCIIPDEWTEDTNEDDDWDMAESFRAHDCPVDASGDFLNSFVKVDMKRDSNSGDHLDSDEDNEAMHEIPTFGSDQRQDRPIPAPRSRSNKKQPGLEETIMYNNKFESLLELDIDISDNMFDSGDPKTNSNDVTKTEVKSSSQPERASSACSSIPLSDDRVSSSDLFGSGNAKVNVESKEESNDHSETVGMKCVQTSSLTKTKDNGDIKENNLPSWELFGSGSTKEKTEIEMQFETPDSSENKTELKSVPRQPDDDGKISSVSSADLFESGSSRNTDNGDISNERLENADGRKNQYLIYQRDDRKDMSQTQMAAMLTEEDNVDNFHFIDKDMTKRDLGKSMSASIRSADLFGSGPEKMESMEFQYIKEQEQFDDMVTKHRSNNNKDSAADETSCTSVQQKETEPVTHKTDDNIACQKEAPAYHQGASISPGIPYQYPMMAPDMNYASYMVPPGPPPTNSAPPEVTNMGSHMYPTYQMPMPFAYPNHPVQRDEKGNPLLPYMNYPGMMPHMSPYAMQYDEKGQPLHPYMMPHMQYAMQLDEKGNPLQPHMPGMMMPIYYMPYPPGQPPFPQVANQLNDRKNQTNEPSSQDDTEIESRDPEKGENSQDENKAESFIYDSPYAMYPPKRNDHETPISGAVYSMAKEDTEHMSTKDKRRRESYKDLKHSHPSTNQAQETEENIYVEINNDDLESLSMIKKRTEVSSRPPLPPVSRPPPPNQKSSKSKKQPVSVYDDADSSEEKENDKTEKESSRTILVKGLPTSITKDALENYFENKRKTGGGEIINTIINRKKLEALIEFKETEDASEVIRRAESGKKYTLSKSNLIVSEYQPPPTDPLKVLIKGIAETTTSECITNFLAANIHTEPSSIVEGETPGTVMACFKTPPDIAKLRKACEKRKCEGNFWSIFEVELVRSIKVKGDNLQTSSLDTLTLYFENTKRSCGGEVQEVKYRDNYDDFIVTFVKAEDAKSVAESRHTISGQTITVSLFYPCLELDEDYVVKIPPAIQLDDLDEYIIKFILNSERFKRELETKVRDYYGSIEWPSAKDENNAIQIQCTVDPKDTKGRAKVKDWAEKCRRPVKEITDSLSVDKSKNVAVEVWSELNTRLREIKVSNPEAIAVFLESGNCVVVMVGETKDVQTMTSQLHTIIKEIETKLDDEKQTVTKKRKLKPFEMTLLRAAKIDITLKKKPVQVVIDNDQREISCKGKQREVDSALAWLDSKLKSFVKRHVKEMSKQAIDLLFKKEARDIVKKRMIVKKVIGVWEFPRGAGLVMYSKSERDLDTAIEVLKSSIVMDSFELDNEKSDILDGRDGKAKIAEFEQNHSGCVSFTTLPNELRFVCVDEIHKEIQDEFIKLFDLHSLVSKTIPTDAGVFNYIATFKRREIDALENQYKRLAVEIKESHRRPWFIVKGKKDGCTLAITKLQGIIDSVVQKDHTVSWPGFDKFLQSSEGRDTIKSIELNEKCVVKVSSEVLSSGIESTRQRKTSSPQRIEGRKKISKEVQIGTLALENVDVIVNSTNKDLDLGVGAISSTLLKAGGDGLDRECKAKYPDGIKPGEVAVTSGGAMKCKQLYHGLLARWDGGQGHAERVMEDFIKTCLTLANTRKHSSIAFPALGTGALGFPAYVVAQTMFDIVDAFEVDNPDTSLRKVRFVIWSQDKVVVKAFEDVESNTLRRRSTGSRQSYRHSEAAGNLIVKNKGFSTTIGPVSVSIVKDDLTSLTSGAIVNSTTDDLNLNTGAVSKAILTAAGFSIQNEAMAKKSLFTTHGLVITSPGKLMCQNIIHVRARNSLSGWAETIKHCLVIAEKLGLNSIAFPALGTGGKGISPDRMAQTMIETFQDYIKSPDFQRCLKTIRIVIFDEKMLGVFISESQATLDGEKPSGWRSYLPDLKFWEKKPEAAPVSKVTIHIYAGSAYGLDTVVRKFDEIRKEIDVFVPRLVLEHMDETIKSDLRRIGYSFGVKVVVERSSVKVLGYGKSAETAFRKTRDYVKEVEADIRKGNTASSVKLPSSWSKMKLTDPTKIELLKPGDADYVSVSVKFLQETGFAPTSVVKIERIQNPTLYTQYIGKKTQMEFHNSGGRKVEQMLWHGTKITAVDNIKNKGFDRNYNSGASHGVGVYFAKQAAMSARGYCSPDVNGHKQIFLAHVLTGEYVVATGPIRVPPLNPTRPNSTYDSTTDNVQAPNFFVIFHDAQAYPSFMITFR